MVFSDGTANINLLSVRYRYAWDRNEQSRGYNRRESFWQGRHSLSNSCLLEVRLSYNKTFIQNSHTNDRCFIVTDNKNRYNKLPPVEHINQN